jgi:hypothetical protein
MTQTATRRHAGGVPRLAAWIARLQRQLSDRVFAGGDAFAREHGWEITKTTDSGSAPATIATHGSASAQRRAAKARNAP